MCENKKSAFTVAKNVRIKYIVVFAKECSYCGRKLDDNGKCPYCG